MRLIESISTRMLKFRLNFVLLFTRRLKKKKKNFPFNVPVYTNHLNVKLDFCTYACYVMTDLHYLYTLAHIKTCILNIYFIKI